MMFADGRSCIDLAQQLYAVERALSQAKIASLNRPGGNATGIVNLGALLAPKRLQLLHELIPDVAAFGVLADPGASGTPFLIPDLHAAARTLGRQLVVAYAGTDSDLELPSQVFRNSALVRS
jgi:ABC-type uncharacterized transport system substrate-binding protein